MDNVSAVVAEAERSEAGATAAWAATEHPLPVFIILVRDGPARTFWSAADTSKPYTLPGVRRPKLRWRRADGRVFKATRFDPAELVIPKQ